MWQKSCWSVKQYSHLQIFTKAYHLPPALVTIDLFGNLYKVSPKQGAFQKVYASATLDQQSRENIDQSSLNSDLSGPVVSDSEAELDSPSKDQLVELGSFAQPHGLKGELKFLASTDELEERLSQNVKRWAWLKGRRNSQYKACKLEGFRSTISKGNLVWLIKLEGVNSVEEAELFRGLTLGMLAKDRPVLEDDNEFYVQDLIGMKVVLNSDKTLIGTVSDIYDGTGEHDLLRVDLLCNADPKEEKRKCLIPFVREIVPSIDFETSTIEITPPEGLLDIRGLLKANSTPKKKKEKSRPQSSSTSLQAFALEDS